MASQPRSPHQQTEFAILYHSLFDYPLDKTELKYWKPGIKNIKFKKNILFESKNGWSYLKGDEGVVASRLKREKISVQKLAIAKQAAKTISFMPTVEFVGVTGSLAMNNSKVNSDIDFLLVCRPGTLWASRLLVSILLKANGFKTRKAGLKTQKNMICINMWMEKDDLQIYDINIYTAHELLQIKPLVDKNDIFTKLLKSNKWTQNYWPNAYKSVISTTNPVISTEVEKSVYVRRFIMQAIKLLNYPMYFLQYLYMKSKITNETVKYKRAFFHPRDGSKWVEKKLQKTLDKQI